MEIKKTILDKFLDEVVEMAKNNPTMFAMWGALSLFVFFLLAWGISTL